MKNEETSDKIINNNNNNNKPDGTSKMKNIAAEI